MSEPVAKGLSKPRGAGQHGDVEAAAADDGDLL